MVLDRFISAPPRPLIVVAAERQTESSFAPTGDLLAAPQLANRARAGPSYATRRTCLLIGSARAQRRPQMEARGRQIFTHSLARFEFRSPSKTIKLALANGLHVTQSIHSLVCLAARSLAR